MRAPVAASAAGRRLFAALRRVHGHREASRCNGRGFTESSYRLTSARIFNGKDVAGGKQDVVQLPIARAGAAVEALDLRPPLLGAGLMVAVRSLVRIDSLGLHFYGDVFKCLRMARDSRSMISPALVVR
jgi:hypothetical protein